MECFEIVSQVSPWYIARDSNPELTGYKPGTLTVELAMHMVVRVGFEPTLQ